MQLRHWRWVTGMIDPHMPLLAEIRALRSRLGTDDAGDWRTLRCPLSPCLASVFLALDEETAGNPGNASTLHDSLGF